MKRTVSIPVELDEARFLPLFEQCAAIFNAHVDWALELQNNNKQKAHHALYAQMREAYPMLPSAFTQTMRDTAMEAVKATEFKKRPQKKAHSGLRYDVRTMTLRGEQLTLSCMGKRVRVILNIPAEYFRPVVVAGQLKGEMLTYRKREKRLRAQSGREKRFKRDVNHCVTKKIAAQPNVTTFILEALSGSCNKRRGKKLNKRLGDWPFFQFETFLTYKAEGQGKKVVFVDARYTSQRCRLLQPGDCLLLLGNVSSG